MARVLFEAWKLYSQVIGRAFFFDIIKWVNGVEGKYECRWFY